MMQRKYKILLPLFSGVLLWLSWYPYGFTFLIFFAFIPLFMLSDKLLTAKKGLVFWQGIKNSFPAFLIWNVGVTWWIWNSTPPGSVAAIVLNAFFMSCVFGAWHRMKKCNLPNIMIPLTFIAFWCSWEFLHLHWQINWPWLNLGNVFAASPKIIQWYEYTGTFGGTIWILIINFLFYNVFNLLSHQDKKSASIFMNVRHLRVLKPLITLTLTMLIPVIISLIIYKTYNINQRKPIEAVIVQQNIDPWMEQYRRTNPELVDLIIEIAKQKLTSNTALLVCPESALSSTCSEEQLFNLDIYYNPSFQMFNDLFEEYPQLNVILGLSTVAFFDSKVSPTAREYSGEFAEYYNSSCLYSENNIQLYRKSRLVPGVEKMPYPKIFGFLEKLAIDLGGINGSLGVDTQQRAFVVNRDQSVVKVGVPICYESIFGELFSKFVKNGAQVMCVITNDAWWGNTPGYKQHFEMSRLRAIETRRYVLRAANTGISGFIDPIGNANQKTEYETRTAIAQTVYLNDEITFYTKYGDYLARIMLAISALIILIPLSRLFRTTKNTVSLFYLSLQDKKSHWARLVQMSKYIDEENYFAIQPDKFNLIHFNDEKGTLRLSIKFHNLYYIESSDNYVNIYYENKGKIARFLLRRSLKSIEDNYVEYPLVRCHRFYIVNINKVKVLRKDKEGLFLDLDYLNLPDLPISKTYYEQVIRLFHQ